MLYEVITIKFYINPQAKFSDNHDINAEDVVFSFNILKEKGNPFYRSYYGGVKNVEAIDNKTVIFNFKDASNRELPFILGQMPILPKHYWRDKEFDKVNLDIPVTSGPYIIKDFSAGRYITYERNKEYWAKDLPVNRITSYNVCYTKLLRILACHLECASQTCLLLLYRL